MLNATLPLGLNPCTYRIGGLFQDHLHQQRNKVHAHVLLRLREDHNIHMPWHIPLAFLHIAERHPDMPLNEH